MAFVYETGLPAMQCDPNLFTTVPAAPAFGNDSLIDASGEKIAFIGNVWHPTIRTGSINIRAVEFRTGAVTMNAASRVRVSLQNVSQTAGPPWQPDGVQDQFADMTPMTSNANQGTPDFSSDRVVDLSAISAGSANPRRLAVVFEFAPFNTSDSVIISTWNTYIVGLNFAGTVLYTGGSWATTVRVPLITLRCSDGSYAFLQSALPPISSTGTVTMGPAAAVRRSGVAFRVPTKRILDRVSLAFRLPSNCDGRVVLYDGDGATELASVDLDNDDYRATTTDYFSEIPISPVTLTAGTVYRLVFVATAGNSAHVVVDVGPPYAAGMYLGNDAYLTNWDGSTWIDYTMRRPAFGLGFCAYDDGAGGGGGGGLLVHPGMTGGIRG